jgi:steroid delta-isomerase-like uncharacterized protein
MIHIMNDHWFENVGGPSFSPMTPTAIRNNPWLALATLVACGCAHPTNRSTAMSDQTRDDNKRSVEKLFDTFNHGDLGVLDELVAPDYVGPQGDKGPAGFRAIIVGLRTAFPDLHYTIDDLVADNDKVAVRWHWTGTHRAPFRAYPATGKAVTNPGLGIFRLERGKIVAATLETDRLGFLQQVGAVPENVGLAARPSPAAAPPAR